MILQYRKTRNIIERGTRAAQPLATDVLNGSIYYVTDEAVTERSNGAAWQSISDAGIGAHSPVTLSGSPNYITLSGQDIIRGLISLTAHVSGILPIANGGAGGLTNGRVPIVAAGVLSDDADFTFSVDTLTVTKLSTPNIIGAGAITITPAAGSNLNIALSTTGDLAIAIDVLYVDTSTKSIGVGTTAPATLAFSASSKIIHLKDTVVGTVMRMEGSASNLEFGSGTNSFFWVTTNTALGFATNNTERARFAANGNFGVGTTTIPSLLTVNGLINLKNYTVATLPTGTRGDIAYVTDALAPSFLAVLVGGGAVVTPCFYNGANWIGF